MTVKDKFDSIKSSFQQKEKTPQVSLSDSGAVSQTTAAAVVSAADEVSCDVLGESTDVNLNETEQIDKTAETTLAAGTAKAKDKKQQKKEAKEKKIAEKKMLKEKREKEKRDAKEQREKELREKKELEQKEREKEMKEKEKKIKEKAIESLKKSKANEAEEAAKNDAAETDMSNSAIISACLQSHGDAFAQTDDPPQDESGVAAEVSELKEITATEISQLKESKRPSIFKKLWLKLFNVQEAPLPVPPQSESIEPTEEDIKNSDAKEAEIDKREASENENPSPVVERIKVPKILELDASLETELNRTSAPGSSTAEDAAAAAAAAAQPAN